MTVPAARRATAVLCPGKRPGSNGAAKIGGDIDGGLVQQRLGHLACHGTFPDQLVQFDADQESKNFFSSGRGLVRYTSAGPPRGPPGRS